MTPNELLAQATCGNVSAYRFLTDLTDVFHFWDDLVDRDQPLTDAYINTSMRRALVDVPQSAFYQANFIALNALVVVAIQNWLAATNMERAKENLHIAFIARSSYVDLAIYTAYLCGGPDHAAKMAPLLRKMTHGEGYEGYLENLKLEENTRLGNVV